MIDFYIDPSMGNSLIGRACMSYLSDESLPRLENIPNPQDRPSLYDIGHSLFSYATLHWSSHLCDGHIASAVEAEKLANSIIQFGTKDILSNWVRKCGSIQ